MLIFSRPDDKVIDPQKNYWDIYDHSITQELIT